jgi:hypothetical protein
MGTVGSFPGAKAAGAWSRPLTSNYCRGQDNMDLYIHSPIRLHSVVLNKLSTGTTLRLPCFHLIMTHGYENITFWNTDYILWTPVDGEGPLPLIDAVILKAENACLIVKVLQAFLQFLLEHSPKLRPSVHSIDTALDRPHVYLCVVVSSRLMMNRSTVQGVLLRVRLFYELCLDRPKRLVRVSRSKGSPVG